jgi:hypothetical protein
VNFLRSFIDFMHHPSIHYLDMHNAILDKQLESTKMKNMAWIENLDVSEECKNEILEAYKRFDRCRDVTVNTENELEAYKHMLAQRMSTFYEEVVEIGKKYPNDASKIGKKN